jgi:predicted metal-dependent phosphoesterase TrpH
MRLVRGAELSCISPDGRGGTCTVHVLAYLFDPAAPAMIDAHTRSQAERRERLHRIASLMAADGLPVDADELLAGLPLESTAGRPHLAQALVRAGVVSTVDEAFVRLLNDRGRYYVPSSRTPALEAIELVARSGGVSVLAHAFAHYQGPTVTASVIADLAKAGLDGLEVDHPNHDPDARAQLRGLAAELGLLITGSSDYHGTNKTIHLGQESTAPEMLEAIAERATGAEILVG